MSLRVTLRAWSIPLGPRTVVAEQAVAPDGARKPRYARQRAPRENGGSFGGRPTRCNPPSLLASVGSRAAPADFFG